MIDEHSSFENNLVNFYFFVFSPMFDNDIKNVWNYESSVEQYQAFGGTSRNSVEKQIQKFEDWIKTLVV